MWDKIDWDEGQIEGYGVMFEERQPTGPEEIAKVYSVRDGYLTLRLDPCTNLTEPKGPLFECPDQNTSARAIYSWNGNGDPEIQEVSHKVMEIGLRCSSNNELGGALGWGFLAERIYPSFRSPVEIGPRFESYSSESNSSLEGFWATSGDDDGNIVRKPVRNIDLTEYHIYTIFWEKGNATFLVDGIKVAFIDQVPSWGMGASAYVENTIYSPEKADQAYYSDHSVSRFGGVSYGGADLTSTRWIQIDYVGYYGMPTQSLLPVPGEGFIPDPDLEALIRQTLGKPTADLEREELASLRSLSGRSGIRNLGGVEYASNLEELTLPQNSITDLGPLSGLINLRVLRLDGNRINDISPLSNLKNLEVLFLDANFISDLTPLSDLTNLRQLYLDWNRVADVSPLANLTNLRTLRLSHNEISDISDLSDLTALTRLYVIGNEISSLSPIAGLVKLDRLMLDGNPASDISPLSELTDLKWLSLGGKWGENEWFDTEWKWTGDKWVYMDVGPSNGFAVELADPEILSKLANLEYLRLTEVQPLDYSLLSELPNLTSLGLEGSQLEDLSRLSDLTGLEDLCIGGNRVDDISTLSSLKNLQRIELYGNHIVDLHPLTLLGKLERLSLSSNYLTLSQGLLHPDDIDVLTAKGVIVGYRGYRD
jgi:Leucine-rich repeat (LRR) protein